MPAVAGWVRDDVMQESTRDELVQLRDGIAAGAPVVFDAVAVMLMLLLH